MISSTPIQSKSFSWSRENSPLVVKAKADFLLAKSPLIKEEGHGKKELLRSCSSDQLISKIVSNLSFSGQMDILDIDDAYDLGAQYLNEAFAQEKYYHEKNLIILLNDLDLLFYQDTDIFSLRSGRIIKTEDQECKDLYLFYLLLAHTYGMDLAYDLFKRYDLQDKQLLTFAHLKMCLVGISARCKSFDLKALFYAVTKDKDILPCKALIDEANITYLKEFEYFELIDLKAAKILYNAFRSHFTGFSVPSLLATLYPLNKRSTHHPKLLQDIRLLEELESMKSFRDEPLFQNFSHNQDFLHHLLVGEYHARQFAYRGIEHEMILPVITRQGEESIYKVVHKLSDCQDGVIAFFLTPLDQTEKKWTKENPLDIELLFRGTHPYSHATDAGASILRDFDFSGVGRSSFNARTPELLDKLLAIISKKNIHAAHLNLNGHSLGGCDAQRMLAFLSTQLTRKDRSKYLSKIKKIHLNTHNAPGVEVDVNAAFISNIGILEKIDPNFKIEIIHAIVKKDLFQMGGAVYIGAQTFSPLVDRKVVLRSLEQAPLKQLHSGSSFGPMRLPFEYEIIEDNQSHMLETILGKWAKWKEESIYKKVIHLTSWIAYPLHILAYSIMYLALKLFRTFIWVKKECQNKFYNSFTVLSPNWSYALPKGYEYSRH